MKYIVLIYFIVACETPAQMCGQIVRNDLKQPETDPKSKAQGCAG